MPYDETLAQRVRDILSKRSGYAEKKMFGGICFLLNGNMCCGVSRDDLMLRVGAERHNEALTMKHARQMDFTGRPMVGMIFVSPEGVQGDAPLRNWVEMAAGHVSTLPAKKTRGGTAGTGKKKSAGTSGTPRPKK